MNAVIIVSGGSGSRMKSAIPKQYIEVNGKPIIAWTVGKFLQFDSGIEIIIVIGKNHEEYWTPIANEYFPQIDFVLTYGGETRFESVRNGLKRLKSKGITGIHDAARPLVSVDTIKRCYKSAKTHHSGIPVMPVEESIRILDGANSKPVEREKLLRVQTPQVFLSHEISEAYKQPPRREFTDDATVYEKMFRRINTVEGNSENIKITYHSDIEFAARLLIEN